MSLNSNRKFLSFVLTTNSLKCLNRTTPRFHGVGIFYGTQCTLTCSVQSSTLPRRRNLLWYSMQPTSSVQASTLPRCRNVSMLPWHRNLLWCSMPNNSSVQTSTLPQCRNFSILPWRRNLLWCLMPNNGSIQPSTLPRCRNFSTFPQRRNRFMFFKVSLPGFTSMTLIWSHVFKTTLLL